MGGYTKWMGIKSLNILWNFKRAPDEHLDLEHEWVHCINMAS